MEIIDKKGKRGRERGDRPGDTIRIECDLTERLAAAYFMRAKVTNATTGKLAARLELACTVTAPQAS